MKEEWFSIWNTVLTDYSKTGMYAQNVTHSISVKNEKAFDKVRLRFNNTCGEEEAIYQNIILTLEDGRQYRLTCRGEEKVGISPGKCIYLDEVQIGLASGTVTISYEVECLKLNNAALLPSTSYMQLTTEGMVTTAIPVYKKMVSSIPKQYHWHFGLDDICLGIPHEIPWKKVLFLGDSNFHREYLVNSYRECNPDTMCVNRGINGNRLLQGTILPAMGEINGIAAINRIKNETTLYHKIYILIGINDIILPYEYGKLQEVVSPEKLIAGLEALEKQAQSICSSKDAIVFLTLLPFKGHPAWNGLSESIRNQVNRWIKTRNHLDISELVACKTEPERLERAYAEEDALHLNEQGGNVVAVYMN